MKSKPIKIGKNHPTMRFVTAVAKAVNLENICVSNFRGERKGNPTDTVTVSFGHRTHTTSDKDAKKIFVLADFRMTAKPRGEAASEDILAVEMRMILQYDCPTVEQFDEETLTAFGNFNGIYNAWPYWREFLQSSTTRMGFPAIVAPVFRVSDALSEKRQVKEVASKAITASGNTG